MYRIKFYRSRDGKKPVLEYLRGLTKKNDKDSRIKANKIRDYIKTLSHYGTAIGEPYIVRNWTAIYGKSGLYRTGYSLLHGSEKVFFLSATLLYSRSAKFISRYISSAVYAETVKALPTANFNGLWYITQFHAVPDTKAFPARVSMPRPWRPRLHRRAAKAPLCRSPRSHTPG